MQETKILRANEISVNKTDWGELKWFASRELGNSETMTMGLCVIAPGYENPRHSHPNCDELLHVLSGRIRHTFENGGVTEMVPGDTISVPPNVVHNAANIGDEAARLLICFSNAERKTVGE